MDIRKRVLTLLSGAGFAQLVTILSVPVLGRLYGPEEFGRLGAVMAVVSLALVIVHGRYHLAIPVVKSQVEAVSLLVLSLVLSILMTIPVVTIFALVLGNEYGELGFLEFVIFASSLTLLAALIDILGYWRSRKGRFIVSAQNAVIRSFVTVGSQLIFSFNSTFGLLYGAVVGVAAATLFAVVDFVSKDIKAVHVPAKRELMKVGVAYRGYPLYSVPQGWVAALSWNAMPLLLLKFAGAGVAGQYWFAYRVLIAPLSLFNGSYRQAVLPYFGQRSLRDCLKKVLKHSLVIVGLLALPAFLLFKYGGPVFGILVGEEWIFAGVLASWMVVGVAGDVVKIPMLCLLQSRHLQGQLLVWEISILISRYALAFPFLLAGDMENAVAVFGCFGFVAWCFFVLVSFIRYRGYADELR